MFGIVALAMLPGLNPRVYHYISGIMLVSFCGTRGIFAYLFQGRLIGLLLSGDSRTDFASKAGTDFTLLRGETGLSLNTPFFIFDEIRPHNISWSLDPEEITTDHTGAIDGG